jgi:biotin carboxylase
MIIGGGVEQIPAYERAKNRGLRIVGTDIDPNAPALQLADHVLVVSTKDAQATALKAEEFNRIHKIDGVMTIANDVPYTVALVANQLGLPSLELHSAVLATDKLLMKDAFTKAGVECPWYSEVNSENQLAELTEDRDRQDYVIKPTDGSGARGVLLINGQTDIKWAYAEAVKWGRSGSVIVEKFIPGLQLSSESFILDGKCFTPALAERNYSRLDQFRPHIIEDGGTIPALIDASLNEKISDLILRGALAMGIERGIVKGDLVIGEDGEPLIIELAARLSGGWLSTHQIPATTGVDLVNAVISDALGIDVKESDLVAKFNRATAIRYFFPPEGQIVAIDGLDEIARSSGVLKYGIFRQVGDFQPKVLMHPDRFGFVLVEADTREQAIELVDQAISKLTIKVKMP